VTRRQDRPSLPDLLHLVDRAMDGRLVNGEGDQLRAALRRGHAAASTTDGLEKALYKARRDLRLAEDELAALRAPTAPPRSAMDVACPRPTCTAPPGRRCHGPYGDDCRHPHADRVRAAQARGVTA
jgi:hypothetical protein